MRNRFKMEYANMTDKEFIQFIVENSNIKTPIYNPGGVRTNISTNINNPIELRTQEAKEKFNGFASEENKIKDIVVDRSFNDIKDKFEAYETEDYYVLKVVEKSFNIGTPGFETIMSNNEKIYILIEAKKWDYYYKKINHLGLEFNLHLYDTKLNKIKYLLNEKLDKNKFKNFEYRDIGWKYDNSKYDNMYYEQI